MCGIAGSLSWKNKDNPQNIQKIIDALYHRGPDAEGLIQKDPIIFGHRRLSIIDLDPRSNQPLFDHTKQYCITYNGELYNYLTLRSTLESLGAQFKTTSDTEVILESFKMWGVDCLQHFIGMFAFALWDAREQQLFLARDRMGEKPLFYAPYNGQNLESGLIFASELKGLVAHPHVKKEVNIDALKQFLTFNYLLTDTCIFQNIYKLPPAHFLLLKKGNAPALKCYWHLKDFFLHKKEIKEQEAIEECRALLKMAVEGQMVSNVPLGSFLSGGIDSSTVTHFMKTGGEHKTETFSIGFVEKGYSELEQSREVAALLGTDHHTQIVKGDLVNMLDKILKTTDEPFADSSIIPTYFLSKFARESVTVALSGDGGDELFGGYETYLADKLFLMAEKTPMIFRRGAHKLSHFLPTSFNKISFDYKVKQFFKGSLLNFQEAHLSWRQIFDQQEIEGLTGKAFKQWTPYGAAQKFYEDVRACDPLDQAMYVDMKTWLVDDILVKVDRASMAHSLEVRAPFLDHRVVEFAASLPVSFKLRGFEKKYLLKKMMHPALPKSILYQKKKGFNAPLSLWFKNELESYGYDITTSRFLEPFLDLDSIKGLWNDHRTQKKDNGFKLFGVLAFSLWLQEYR